ncbi:NUDIX hydrolase [Streptomyces sp. NPDC092296]|uniref:NUDIX hydrolase n=1 Tax=Streptomyces sp. NPDC092296 TaxID=3366012 RepID=UPI003825A4D7
MTADPSDELLDVVDAHDRVVGTARRGEVYRRRLTHRCVFILCRDAEDRIFVHRRAPTKLFSPSMYDMFVGGVVGSGESYATAAVREAEEELGVSGIEPQHLFKFLFTTRKHSWWCEVYEARWTGPVVPQVEEIDWHTFLTERELAERMAEWPFVLDGTEAWHRYLRHRSGG